MPSMRWFKANSWPLLHFTALFGTLLACSVSAQAQTLGKSDPPEHIDFRLDFGRLSLEPLILTQVQAAPWVGDDSFFQAGDPAEQAGFRLRRARMGFRGRLFDIVSFAITTDLVSDADGTARLLDAAIGYHHWEWLQMIAGAHVVPYSRIAMAGSADIALIERPFSVRALAPNRQVGLQLYGSLWEGALEYRVGVYNGFQQGNNYFQGYDENAATFGNRFDEMAYVVRLSSEPLGPLGRNIQDLYESDFRLGFGGGYFYSSGGARETHGASADMLMHWMGAHLLVEFLWQKSSPKSRPTVESSVLADVTSWGLVAELGYTIIQRIGLYGRFEWMDPNTKVDNELDGWAASGGVSYHFIDNALKAQLEYTHREERFGKKIDNDLVLFQLALNLGGLP